MINRPSFEQIFHNAPKKVGMVEIYYSPISARSVKELENIIKAIAKEMHINMDKPSSGREIKVYVYPNDKIFYSFFGSSIEKNTNIFKKKNIDTMNFIETEDGAIHMYFSGGKYNDIMKILVSKVFDDYIEEKRERTVKDLVNDELEPEELEEELDEEEIEEELEDNLEEEEVGKLEPEEPEEELNEEELNSIVDADNKIEEIKQEKKVNVPEWLDLGWIMYKRGKLRNAKNIQDYAKHIKEKGVTGSGRITKKQGTFSEYNYADESAYAFVEYIIENYGFKKLVALFDEPDIKKTLGISKEQFKRDSKEAIKNKYVKSKLSEIKLQKKDKIKKSKNIKDKDKEADNQFKSRNMQD